MELCEMEESFSLGKVYGQISIFSGVWEKKKKTAWKIFAFHLQTHIQSWLPSLPPQQLNSHSQQPFCQTSLPRICRVSERLRMRKLWVALKLTGAEFARKCYLKDQKYDLFYYCLLNSRPTQTFPQLHCTSCSTTMWHHLNTFNMATVTTGSEPEHSSLSFFREIKVESHTLTHTHTHPVSPGASETTVQQGNGRMCAWENSSERRRDKQTVKDRNKCSSSLLRWSPHSLEWKLFKKCCLVVWQEPRGHCWDSVTVCVLCSVFQEKQPNHNAVKSTATHSCPSVWTITVRLSRVPSPAGMIHCTVHHGDTPAEAPSFCWSDLHHLVHQLWLPCEKWQDKYPRGPSEYCTYFCVVLLESLKKTKTQEFTEVNVSGWYQQSEGSLYGFQTFPAAPPSGTWLIVEAPTHYEHYHSYFIKNSTHTFYCGTSKVTFLLLLWCLLPAFTRFNGFINTFPFPSIPCKFCQIVAKNFEKNVSFEFLNEI